MALTTAYIATLRGRPPSLADGNSSAINTHCSHVRLLGYALVICSRGVGIYKFQLKPCELSYYTPSLLKHPLKALLHEQRKWYIISVRAAFNRMTQLGYPNR